MFYYALGLAETMKLQVGLINFNTGSILQAKHFLSHNVYKENVSLAIF